MAMHKNPVKRWTCGSCNYTEYVKETWRSTHHF
jgi:ribosomal protein S27AE